MEEKNINYYKGKTKTEIDIERLKNEVAQFLKIDNLNFLIGAGCSSYLFEGKEQGIPSMADMYSEFFDKYPEFKVADSPLKNLFDNNLEKMLEAMNAISVANEVIEIDSEIDIKIDNVREFLREKIVNGMHSEKILELYHTFYMKTVSWGRKNPINIFTTNYDLYNEQALDLLSFPYNNGFIGTYKRTFNPASYKYAYVENMNLSNNMWERVPNFYNLYKLHGSITWVKNKGEIREVDQTQIENNDTVMIYPTPLKDRTTLMTPYSDLFRNMESELLKQNSILITIGYSFGDEHINRLILNSLAIPSFKLVVFGESDSINKLLKINDTRIIVINSEDKIHYFNNIVEKVMPNIQENVEEQIDLPNVSELVKLFNGERDE